MSKFFQVRWQRLLLESMLASIGTNCHLPLITAFATKVVEAGKEHLASLDSLRGVGVILIFANHFIEPTHYIFFGWIGLWIFFSLSGYLITDGLLKMKTLPGRQYFGRFYAKRAFRILPALLVFFTISVGLYFAFPRWLAGGPTLSRLWVYLVTFTFNYHPLEVSGGFWFNHLWSLSLEEQFYVVWPWLIFFLPRNWLKKVAASWILVTPALRLIVHSLYGGLAQTTAVVHASLLCQADAFAVGACVAIFRAELPRESKKLLWIMTTAVIAIGLVNYFAGASVVGPYWRTLGWPHLPHSYLGQFNHGYVWGYSIINMWAAALILSCLRGTAPSILNFPPLVFLGRISYGAYLSHFPLLGVYLYYLKPINAFSVRGFVIFLIWFANVVIVSWFSFRFLEVPFLRIKNRLGGTQRTAISVAPSAQLLRR
jgi:peptidoglycan/LPS O-acetylase OafA/YrhL